MVLQTVLVMNLFFIPLVCLVHSVDQMPAMPLARLRNETPPHQGPTPTASAPAPERTEALDDLLCDTVDLCALLDALGTAPAEAGM